MKTIFGLPVVECEGMDRDEVMIVGPKPTPVEVEIVDGDPPIIRLTFTVVPEGSFDSVRWGDKVGK